VAGTGGFQKAKLRVVAGTPDGPKELRFLFNPSEYTIAKGATWNRPQSSGAKSASKPQFGGANPQTVQMEIFFDDYEKHAGDIAADLKTLLDWVKPTSDSVKKKKPQPPILGFEWGKNQALTAFNGYLKSVSVKYTMFDGSGKVLRATANVTLEEVPIDVKRTNPTSGSPNGRRRHILGEGETLHSIAFQEYGDPTLWRGLAAFNDIDDPLRVPAGTAVLIPTLAEADRLA
jgi:nucleoid-associated protein YgaU